MRAAVVQTLTIVENSNTDLKKRLTAEEQARKSADAALEGAEGKPRARGSWHVRPMTNWLLPRSNWQL